MIAAVALDLGTTTIKAGLLLQDGSLGGIVAKPAPTIRVTGGRYESDALEYAELADQVLSECLARTGERPPLGLCSQRSSFLVWDSANGQPVTPLISWQDDRGAESCIELGDEESRIRDLSGLPLTPYYLAPKLRVLLRNDKTLRKKLASGEWLLGTLDTFLIWRWTGGAQYVTDASMAARTLLLNIRTQQWSTVLCDLFDIPLEILPRIISSNAMDVRLQNDLVLQASVGDQSAALVSGIGRKAPEALVNLGTGGFVASFLTASQNIPTGYLQTLVMQEMGQSVLCASEGTLNSISAALAPYPVNVCRVEDMGSDTIYCLAEPSGLGAPYFRHDIGISFSEPVGHLQPERIALLLQEGILFRVARILEDFQREFGIERVYFSGGLSNLPCLQQGIAQCSPLPVFRLLQTDASLFGAAQLAAGVDLTGRRVAERILIQSPMPGLVNKYVRWKAWLDGLLNTSLCGIGK